MVSVPVVEASLRNDALKPTERYLLHFSFCFLRVLTSLSVTWLNFSLKANYSYDFLTFFATSFCLLKTGSLFYYYLATRLLKQLSSFFFCNFFQASSENVSFIVHLLVLFLNWMRELHLWLWSVSSVGISWRPWNEQMPKTGGYTFKLYSSTSEAFLLFRLTLLRSKGSIK